MNILTPMRTLYTFALALLFTVSCAAGPKMEHPNFTLDLPDGWTVNKTQDKLGIHTVMASHDDGISMMISIWKNDPTFTVEDSLRGAKQAVLAGMDGKALEVPATEWFGKPVKEGLSLTGRSQGKVILVRLYGFETKDTMATVQFGGPLDNFSGTDSNLKAISESLKLK